MLSPSGCGEMDVCGEALIGFVGTHYQLQVSVGRVGLWNQHYTPNEHRDPRSAALSSSRSLGVLPSKAREARSFRF
jgi:hypothetical protein